MSDRKPDEITAATALLAAMKTSGVDYLLANAGTDFPPIIEALAASAETGLDFPEALVIHHENVAVGMGHGYFLVSGKTLGVMVHVNVGLANAAMGLLNAAAARIPILMCSGRTPVTEMGRPGSRSVAIHWGQEMRDQVSLVRESVKWDYELRYPEQAAPSVSRAVAIANSDPCGPVYLNLPREALAEPVEIALAPATYAAAKAGSPDAAALRDAAEAIAKAQKPLIIAQRTAPAGAISALAALAEEAAIPVVEFWSSTNALPTTHPMHAGFDPAPLIADADLVLTIDAMTPWIPSMAQPPEHARIISLGPDPLEIARPYRGFGADIALQCDADTGLAALHEAIRPHLHELPVDARRAAHQAWRDRQSAATEAMVAKGASGPMNHAYVSRVLSEVMDDDTAIFSELGAFGPAITLPKSGGFFWTPLAGGLGWGVPAALGAKLAQPQRDVIAAVGDGSYIFANPAACHQVAATHDLPILTIVFNNGIWNAVKRATTGMYPDGRAVKANEMPLTSLGPSPDYCAMARAHGALAARVEDPADLADALRQALHETRANRRQALLEVAVS